MVLAHHLSAPCSPTFERRVDLTHHEINFSFLAFQIPHSCWILCLDYLLACIFPTWKCIFSHLSLLGTMFLFSFFVYTPLFRNSAFEHLKPFIFNNLVRFFILIQLYLLFTTSFISFDFVCFVLSLGRCTQTDLIPLKFVVSFNFSFTSKLSCAWVFDTSMEPC